MDNQVVWVDIPVKDLERSIKFYSAVLGSEVEKKEFPETTIGLLPGAEECVSGCLVVSNENSPSQNGPLIYLRCEGRLEEAEAVIESNGGKVLTPRQSIGEYGFRTVMLDSEGNRIALHSSN